jgi:hypothetical protein
LCLSSPVTSPSLNAAAVVPVVEPVVEAAEGCRDLPVAVVAAEGCPDLAVVAVAAAGWLVRRLPSIVLPAEEAEVVDQPLAWLALLNLQLVPRSPTFNVRTQGAEGRVAAQPVAIGPPRSLVTSIARAAQATLVTQA